jgi:dolichol-phosphate mannosyltransferase
MVIKMNEDPTLSVIVPMYNEEESVDPFMSGLHMALTGAQISFEIIVINDGSTDKTLEKLTALEMAELKIINFVRNFGHMQALNAGYENSRGSFVASMDGDLQHPFETLLYMFSIITESKVDAVIAFQKLRDKDLFFKRILSQLFYKLTRSMSGIEIIKNAADFRIVNRGVVDTFNSLLNRDKVFRLLIPKLGFTSVYVPYDAKTRKYGKTKYTPKKMIHLAFEGFKGFTTQPLYWILIAGTVTSALGFLWLLSAGYEWIQGNAAPGWASLACAIVIFSGVQMISIGVLGAYVAEIIELIRNRKEYIIKND